MDSGGVLIIIIVIVGIIVLIIKSNESSNKEKAQRSATDKISIRGIQQSIIKQSPSRIYYDSFSMPQGVLVLTWETLLFFGNDKDFEIPVSTIRSTSSEHKSAGTNMVIMADAGTFRFYWEDERRAMSGIASAGGGIATGMGISKSINPNVQEWIQLIDELRLGKLKKPS
jgi:hypothetical protein